MLTDVYAEIYPRKERWAFSSVSIKLYDRRTIGAKRQDHAIFADGVVSLPGFNSIGIKLLHSIAYPEAIIGIVSRDTLELPYRFLRNRLRLARDDNYSLSARGKPTSCQTQTI